MSKFVDFATREFRWVEVKSMNLAFRRVLTGFVQVV